VHELSLATGIVETVVRHAAGRRVSSVQMRVGTMRQVVPDSLDFYFGICSKDTVCEGAALEQEIIRARLLCRACDRESELDLPDFRCPTCSGIDVEVLGGIEFEVESIEVEDNETTPDPDKEKEEEPSIAPR
jgi:hydrogenase nickel incorporation protein HypA/HybF